MKIIVASVVIVMLASFVSCVVVVVPGIFTIVVVVMKLETP